MEEACWNCLHWQVNKGTRWGGCSGQDLGPALELRGRARLDTEAGTWCASHEPRPWFSDLVLDQERRHATRPEADPLAARPDPLRGAARTFCLLQRREPP